MCFKWHLKAVWLTLPPSPQFLVSVPGPGAWEPLMWDVNCIEKSFSILVSDGYAIPGFQGPLGDRWNREMLGKRVAGKAQRFCFNFPTLLYCIMYVCMCMNSCAMGSTWHQRTIWWELILFFYHVGFRN